MKRKSRKRSRADGTNLRALKQNPRALGLNPRALGINWNAIAHLTGAELIERIDAIKAAVSGQKPE
jgi:hypothetical protein